MITHLPDILDLGIRLRPDVEDKRVVKHCVNRREFRGPFSEPLGNSLHILRVDHVHRPVGIADFDPHFRPPRRLRACIALICFKVYRLPLR